MRLICGFVRLDGAPAEPTALSRMISALTPSGASPRIDRRVEGSAALAVLDFAVTASERAGLVRSSAGTWLAADLRLDRPGELATAMGQASASAAEPLVLAALERWGENLPDRIDGDFALAAWDATKRRLLCARDILGVRPLCYSHMADRLFAFASLPKGLHGSGMIPPAADLVALGRLLLEKYPRRTETGFRDIAWLLPGHSLVVTPDRLKLHRAWLPQEDAVGRWRGSAAEAAATLRALIAHAVACRIPASGTVSAHLSGGLDSSAIAVLAARRLREEGRRLHAFSQLARPREGLVLQDESDYVRAVIGQETNIAWSPVYLPPLHGDTVDDPDLLITGPVAMADDAVCAAASSVGAHVLFSGGGGDEAASYNGAELYFALLQQGRWSALNDRLRHLSTRDGTSIGRAAFGRLVRPAIPEWVWRFGRRVRGRSPGGQPLRLQAFLATDIARQLDVDSNPSAEGNRARDRIWKLTESALSGRITRWAIIAARHGVAFTFPLLDRRVIDFSLGLPLELILDRGWSRQPFRNAMEGILPDKVRWRDSKFLSFPDLAIDLAAAKPALLAEAAALRADPAASEVLDMEAVIGVLRDAPDVAEARRIASTLNGERPPPPAVLGGIDALRALTLARHVTRLARTSAM